MGCMKCGRDTGPEQVFCQDCLSEMEKYPVNPNIPVILPRRSEQVSVKKPVKKKVPSPEEQIFLLKRRVRQLSVLLTAMTILAMLLIYPAVKYLMEDHFLPGQNYSTIDSKSSTTEPTQGP